MGMETTLIVNPGSSSRKYALYDDGRLVLDFRFERTNLGFEVCSRNFNSQSVCKSIDSESFSNAFKITALEVQGYLLNTKSKKKLDNIVIRVVSPGSFFQKHRVIDDVYLKELKKQQSFAPLHIPVIIGEIEKIKKYYKDSRIIAASDSAFHSTLPDLTKKYSISATDADKYNLYRFGYHGLSVSSVVEKIHPLIGIYPRRLIVCHIGSGVSVTAIKDGRSVENTMGFSPTSGLIMGSRGGDVDSSSLLQLMRVKNFTPDDAELYLNTRAGLVGLAGESDIRKLLNRYVKGDTEAVLALKMFAFNIQKAIASQTVILKGLDVLALTATAAVRSSELRHLILKNLEYMGIKISPDRNDLMSGKDGVISVRNSQIKVVVVKTDEMKNMLQIVNQV